MNRFSHIRDNAQEQEAAPVEETPKLRPRPTRTAKTTKEAVEPPVAAEAEDGRPRREKPEVVERKGLHGRISVASRRAFNRRLLEAEEELEALVTVDHALEALVQLVVDDDDLFQRWCDKIYELRRK